MPQDDKSQSANRSEIHDLNIEKSENVTVVGRDNISNQVSGWLLFL
jgi:hypothetical protein